MIVSAATITMTVTWLLVMSSRSSYADDAGNSTDDLIGIEGGSGVEESSGNEYRSNDLPPLTTIDADHLFGTATTPRVISKRATKVFYNGLLDREFFSPFSYTKAIIPQTAVIAFNRPLQRGNNIPQLQYIALWAPRGQPPHWGVVALGANGKLDGTFINDRRIYNLSSTDMQRTVVRLLQYTGTETENNFKFSWTRAIDADYSTVVQEKANGLCNPRVAPAVLQEQGYEYLGEADLDNRIMYYVEHNYVNKIEGSLFTNNVFLLTKQQCQCSCPATSY